MIFNVDTAFFLIPSILGVLGNSLVLFVYSRKNNKHSSTLFIISLAVIDFLASLLGMPYTIVVEELDYQLHSDFSCKLYYFSITCIVPFSVYIMVAIAVDRYICICRPHSHILTHSRGKKIIIGLLLLSVVQGLITSMFYGVYLEFTSLTSVMEEIVLSQKSVRIPNNGSLEHFAKLQEMLMKECIKASGNEPLFTGTCIPNQMIMGDDIRYIYQKIYSFTFLVCFLTVFVLYIIIYKSVLERRKSRMAARSRINITQDTCMTETTIPRRPDSPPREEEIALEVVKDNGSEKTHLKTKRIRQNKVGQNLPVPTPQQENEEASDASSVQTHKKPRTRGTNLDKRSTSCSGGTLREKYYLANIRTAIMLFIVTVVFIFTYLPSWLMAHKLIPFNVIIFYCYFINHISNPIIYAFLNPTFRKALKGLLFPKSMRGI